MQQIPTNILQLSEYWHGLAGGETPERSLFRIEDLAPLLPYLLLCDFEFSPFRLRYRLSGTRIDAVTGINLTGRYLDEFLSGDYGASVRTLLDFYEEASRTGRPRLWSYPWAGDNPKGKEVALGIFPLKVNGAVAQCVSIEDYGILNEIEDGHIEPADRRLYADWSRLSRS